MSDNTFFSIQHAVNINIERLADDFQLPNQEAFEQEIPVEFRIASEFSQMDIVAETAAMELKRNEVKPMLSLIEAQNNKINLLLSYVLSLNTDINNAHQTESYSADRFNFLSSSCYPVGSIVKAKLYLSSPAAAIYTYAKITQCEPSKENEDQHLVEASFVLMREMDQDIIIRSTLLQQQKMLRQRASQRAKQQSDKS